MNTIKPMFLLLVPLLIVPTAYAQSVTTVNVAGQVSVSGLTVTVQAHAQGSPSSISGSGADTPVHANAFPPPGECTFPLTGSISGSQVTLSGQVTQTSDPALLNLHVKITADASTGAITFIIGPFTLTGTGTVVIENA